MGYLEQSDILRGGGGGDLHQDTRRQEVPETN